MLRREDVAEIRHCAHAGFPVPIAVLWPGQGTPRLQGVCADCAAARRGQLVCTSFLNGSGKVRVLKCTRM